MRGPVRGGVRIGRVKDLSAGGAYVALPDPFSNSALLQLTVYKDDLVFRCKAKVIHRTDGIGMGLMFREVTAEAEAVLRLWLGEAETGERSTSQTT